MFSKIKVVLDREAWRAAIHGAAKSRTWLRDWSELNWTDWEYQSGQRVFCQNRVSLYILYNLYHAYVQDCFFEFHELIHILFPVIYSAYDHTWHFLWLNGERGQWKEKTGFLTAFHIVVLIVLEFLKKKIVIKHDCAISHTSLPFVIPPILYLLTLPSNAAGRTVIPSHCFSIVI